MYMTEVLGAKCMAKVLGAKCMRNCSVQNVYEGSVGCKMYITEQVGHEK
jgi:hypothetical protein